MSTHIIINDREISHPLAKYAVIAVTVLAVGLVSAMLLFLVLPLIGITIATLFSFALLVVVCVTVGLLAVGFGTGLLAIILGPIDLLIRKISHH